MNNSILVYIEGDVVKHRFCPESEASAFLESMKATSGNAVMFTVDNGDAAFAFEYSQDVKNVVAEAKAKVYRDNRFKAALDRHDVPTDPHLRVAIHKAFAELYS